MANPTNLDELLAAIRADKDLEIDMTDLPTFGGEEISGPVCATLPYPEPVWSWDEKRALVGAGLLDLRIVDRTDLE